LGSIRYGQFADSLACLYKLDDTCFDLKHLTFDLKMACIVLSKLDHLVNVNPLQLFADDPILQSITEITRNCTRNKQIIRTCLLSETEEIRMFGECLVDLIISFMP
jgi:hypothetical protein